jgi:hypothetical protein
MRLLVCNLLIQVLLGLTSTVTLGSKSCRTWDHILLSLFRMSSLSVASYNSQKYGGGISTHLHMGHITHFKVKVILWLMVSWPACPGIRPSFRAHDQFLFLIYGICLQTAAFFSPPHYGAPPLMRSRVCHFFNQRFSQRWLRRMVSSGMLRRVALVRTDVSEELSASFIRMTRIGELGMLAVTSNPHTLRRNTNFFVACVGC